MPALTVTIGATDYDVYADIAFADEFLAGDVVRGPIWAAISGDDAEDVKGRALVSATRALQTLPSWADGVPDISDPPEAVQQACAMLAADFIAKPSLSGNASTASNVRRAKAGSAEVEFFNPQAGTPLPSSVWQLLISAGLIGAPGTGSAAPEVSGIRGRSHFGPHGCDPPAWLDSDYGGPCG